MLQFVGELNIMPVLVLACRMCPKHIEATMYAMLMSTINFGSLLGSWLGAIFLIWMKIDQTDYSRLWLFIAITGVFILLPLPWLYVVREDELLKQREKPLEEDKKEVQSSTPSTVEKYYQSCEVLKILNYRINLLCFIKLIIYNQIYFYYTSKRDEVEEKVPLLTNEDNHNQ